MDFRIFSTDEDDGQLNFFNMDMGMSASEDDYEEDAGEVGLADLDIDAPTATTDGLQEERSDVPNSNETENTPNPSHSATASHEKKSVESVSVASAPLSSAFIPSTGAARISRCQCCGKMLFVREEEGEFLSHCNNCGISYQIRA